MEPRVQVWIPQGSNLALDGASPSTVHRHPPTKLVMAWAVARWPAVVGYDVVSLGFFEVEL